MTLRRIFWGLTSFVLALFAPVSALFAQEALTTSFGDCAVQFEAPTGRVDVSLTSKGKAFAKASFEANKVDSFSTETGKVELALKSGWRLVFSGEYADSGLISVAVRHTGKGVLGSEEPALWEAVCFDEQKYDAVKAFGTAGLKNVDGHAGSYAFLALVEPESRAGVVGGWVTSERAGGVVRSEKSESGAPVMIPRLDYGAFQAEDGDVFEELFVLGAFDDCRIGLENYADAIASHYSIKLRYDAVVGYCTWYSDKHAGACDEESIKELADSLKKNFGDFGMQYLQIDDKWQLGNSKNGPNKNFTSHRPDGPYPSGMKATSEFLNSRGLTAGIWFMPFSGNYNDPWFADKQDLFVRSAIDYPAEGEKSTRKFPTITQKRDKPYETYWGGTCLDMSNPKTRDYVRDIVHRITCDWNFKYIKIDGMWCGSGLEQLYVNDEYLPDDMGLQIFHDPRTTNIENFRSGLTLVREASEGAFILGCNVSQNMRVMASSYGLVDAMRVGPDNGASWGGVCAGPWRGTNRYFYNARVWFNDPDPVYARNSIPVERAQVSATWASLTGQLFALSDWVPDYAPERVDLVRKTIPNHRCKTVRPVDLFEANLARVWLLTDERSGVRRDVVGLFNWSDKEPAEFELTPEKLGLPLTDAEGNPVKEYVAYDFWNDRFVEPFSVFKATLPKESCGVLAVRPVGDRPVLLSTSRHITQGVLEVREEKWSAEDGVLTIVADVPKDMPYELRVYNPATKSLERFTLPEGSAGEKTILYRPGAKDGEQFSVR